MYRAGQIILLFAVCLLLVACGEKSQKDVVKSIEKSWSSSNYDLAATMEVKGGEQSRTYNVTVWHTKPSFYRVEIQDPNAQDSQVIVKNESGVFLTSPSAQKTYKFQSEWPKKNSQSYLIGSLAEDIKSDAQATMKKGEETYIFEVATRNKEVTGLTSQQIVIDKKSLLPKQVTLFDESMKEQIVITFETINMKAKHAPDEYKVTAEDQKAPSTKSESFSVKYPTYAIPNTSLIDEVIVREQGNERAVLSYGGEKSFTIIQTPVKSADKMIAVSVTGNPQWLGSTYGAMNEQSLTWDHQGVSYLLTSTDLTESEMLKIATSLVSENIK